MTKLSKFIYWLMLVICLAGITMGILAKNYNSVMDDFALLCWVGVAWVMEKRCINLQKQIDELYGNNQTKS